MKHGKTEASQRPSGAASNGLSKLVAIVMKIAERMEILEKKTDLVISQTSAGSYKGREHTKLAPQPLVAPQSLRQPSPTQLPNEVKSAPGQPQVRSHERRERVLHKAVCADCHKDCDVPFKPTGERPVYCKECFSKRKANPIKGNRGNQQAPDLSKVTGPENPPQRQVIVTKKGVGKVTVSEIVRSSAPNHSREHKSYRPAKKSKR